MRAETIWIAAIIGVGGRIEQRSPKPYCAPACEYVAMPLGSSSAAPVMRPGPSRLVRPWSSSRMGVFAPASFERTVFAVVAFLAVGMAGDCPRAGRADHRRHERTAAPSSGRRIEEAV